MEKMFGPIMKGFMSGMSADDKLKMNACFEKMSSLCFCCGEKDLPEENRKTMMKKIRSFCGGNAG